jgi:hypothetical protein
MGNPAFLRFSQRDYAQKRLISSTTITRELLLKKEANKGEWYREIAVEVFGERLTWLFFKQNAER